MNVDATMYDNSSWFIFASVGFSPFTWRYQVRCWHYITTFHLRLIGFFCARFTFSIDSCVLRPASCVLPRPAPDRKQFFPFFQPHVVLMKCFRFHFLREEHLKNFIQCSLRVFFGKCVAFYGFFQIIIHAFKSFMNYYQRQLLV